MQDKDIDDLFRTKLNNYEVEPSSEVWDNIKLALNGEKKRFKVYLSIAATVLLFITAALYFKVQLNNEVNKQEQLFTNKNNKPAKLIIAQENVIKVDESEFKKAIAVIKTAKLTRKEVKSVSKALPVDTARTNPPEMQLAQVKLLPAESVKFVVPDKEIQLSIKSDTAEDLPFKANTLAAVEHQNIKVIAAQPVKKHRIRNFGDLINTVVGKVDKRKDKLIEFTSAENDEDESILSGLNLGFIKIKKQD